MKYKYDSPLSELIERLVKSGLTVTEALELLNQALTELEWYCL